MSRMRGAHLAIPLIALALAWLAPVMPAYASCNEFESLQSIILAEGAHQPLAAQIEMARVAVTHGPCNLDSNFYSAFGVAQRIAENEPLRCIAVMPCQAFYMLYTIAPEVRENAAIASYIVLTETPRIPRFHFAERVYSFFYDARACPSGYFYVGTIVVC